MKLRNVYTPILLVLLILLLALASGCGQEKPADPTDPGATSNPTAQGNEIAPTGDEQYYDVYELTDPNSEFNRAIRNNPLDKAYAQEIALADTVGEMCRVEQAYIRLWQAEMERAAAQYAATLSAADKAAFTQVQEQFTAYLEGSFAYEADLVLQNKYEIHLGEASKALVYSQQRERIRQRTIHIKYLHYLLERAAGTATEYISLQFSAPSSGERTITAKGRAYSIEDIQQGILKAFHTEFYYAGDDALHLNRNLILNKTLSYDLVFVDDEYLPHVLLIVNNLEHPLSTEEKPLYKFGVAFSAQGMEEKFYTFGATTRDALTDMTEERDAEYLGSYSLHIREIVKPQHEPMPEEWKQRAEAAIQRYMDKNDFYHEKEKNLEPGKYHVYIKGFAKGDINSVIVFEHENGTVYQGFYYFVQGISQTQPADLNHVALVEDTGGSYGQWLDKVRKNPALHMEYWVQDSARADSVS